MAVERVTRVIGTSKMSFQDAFEEALLRANKSLRGITQIEIIRQKVRVVQGKVNDYVVEVDITFVLEER